MKMNTWLFKVGMGLMFLIGSALGQTYEEYRAKQAEKWFFIDNTKEAARLLEEAAVTSNPTLKREVLEKRLIVAIMEWDTPKLSRLIDLLKDDPNTLLQVARKYSLPNRPFVWRMVRESLEKVTMNDSQRQDFQMLAVCYADDSNIPEEWNKFESMSPNTPEKGDRWYRIAKGQKRRRHWELALSAMHKAKALLDPIKDSVYEKHRARRTDLAIEAIKISWLCYKPLRSMAGKNDPESALREIERIKVEYKDDPYLPVVLHNLAMGLIGQERWDDAKALAQWVLANCRDKMSDPYQVAGCYHWCGNADEAKGRWISAIDNYKKQLELCHQHPSPNIMNPASIERRIARIYEHKLNDIDSAIPFLEHSLTHRLQGNLIAQGAGNEGHRKAALRLARAAKTKQKWPEAAVHFETMLQFYPDQYKPPTILYEAATCWEKAEMMQAALHNYAGFLKFAAAGDIRIPAVRAKFTKAGRKPTEFVQLLGGSGDGEWDSDGSSTKCKICGSGVPPSPGAEWTCFGQIVSSEAECTDWDCDGDEGDCVQDGGISDYPCEKHAWDTSCYQHGGVKCKKIGEGTKKCINWECPNYCWLVFYSPYGDPGENCDNENWYDDDAHRCKAVLYGSDLRCVGDSTKEDPYPCWKGDAWYWCEYPK
jgi:tetratricopeptide (TPR) repeat protein